MTQKPRRSHLSLDIYVEANARKLGLAAFHWPDSLAVTWKGWPDWVFIGTHGILFRENKVPPDKCTPAQRAVGYALQAHGLDWAVWTPADLESGLIIKELERIR